VHACVRACAGKPAGLILQGCCTVYCLRGCLQMVVLWFGVEVAPSFDKPWLSTSFADYWSRRWNLTTTYMLRYMYSAVAYVQRQHAQDRDAVRES
jgi:hypothetical protein